MTNKEQNLPHSYDHPAVEKPTKRVPPFSPKVIEHSSLHDVSSPKQEVSPPDSPDNENSALSSSIQSYVTDRVAQTSLSMERQASRNKRIYFWIHGLVTVFGGLIPLNAAADQVLGLSSGQSHFVSAGIATLMSLLLTLEKILQPQVKWIRFQTAYENLKKEQWLHECKAGGYRNLDQKKADMVFVEKVEELILSNVDSSKQTSK